jgi:tetratricopeptide (TPR) repeat protein
VLLAIGSTAVGVSACSSAPAAQQEADCDAVLADLARVQSARLGTTDADDQSGGLLSRTQAWVESLLVPHDTWIRLGWCQYQAERIEEADAAFREAARRIRFSVDAAVGLGYVALRQDRPGEAALQFADALDHNPRMDDALKGLQLAVERMPVADRAAADAREAARRLALVRTDEADVLYTFATADRKAGGSGELRRRPETVGSRPTWFARVGQDYLEVRAQNGRWSPLFIKGVNIGPALPGRFPSEAPEDLETWGEWLSSIAGLGANAVRVYTLLPPAFYRALKAHNRQRPDSHLWLLQGVWADLPPGDDFDDAGYLEEFHAAISRAVDAVHGDLVVSPPRGTSRGVYDADVSDDTLAWIVGREWEPFAVVAYEEMNPGNCEFSGKYITVSRGRAMECWIGRSLDFAAAYEVRRYGEARPLTFANWPTLDPLSHPTEATRAEEDAWRLKRRGIPIPERSAPAWDDDAAVVDATLMSGSPGFEPGVFASYHIYPNYPYFINLEPKYDAVRDDQGINRYAGYLRELKAYHGTQPVLVAEYGMSTSRGVAHIQPQGLHHGGHNEPDAMRENARLLRSIYEEGMAGGVAFAFIDEWFKSTWPTSPFEIPEERRPFWFNGESPEQSYGLFAVRPVSPVRLDGDAADWAPMKPLAAARTREQGGWTDLKAIRATFDAGWLYILLETAGRGPVDWSRTAYAIGIDTYGTDLGERTLPAPLRCPTRTGVEFGVRLRGPASSELLVTPSYEQRHPAETGVVGMMESPRAPSGRWVIPSLLTNRERYTRDGTSVPAERVFPGKLRFGSLHPASPQFNTLADVAVGTEQGVLELRLPWGLLNFGDPSTSQVLHSPRSGPAFETTRTDAVRLYACAGDPRSGKVRSSLPADGEAVLPLTGWGEPDFVFEPKQGLELFADAVRRLPESPERLRRSPAGDGT